MHEDRTPACGKFELLLGRDILIPQTNDVVLKEGVAQRGEGRDIDRLGQIDAILGHCLKRPLPKAAAFIVDVLRTGVAQLLFLQTPAHAAVDSSVRLADKQPGAFKGLVNGVLRRITREADALTAAYHEPILNTPDWLRKE